MRCTVDSADIYQVYDIRTDIRPTVAEIDLGALRGNADVVRSVVGPTVGILAVVKADAYGHGAVACARALERKVWGFGVSLVEEGVELRRGGILAPILVLGNFYGTSHRDVVAYKLTPVVSDIADLVRFERAIEDIAAGSKLGLHLKIDTGMARVGLSPAAVGAFLDELSRKPSLELTGLCTHLADAEGDEAATRKQLVRFAQARKEISARGFSPTLTHVANSAGTLRFADARFDLVRPGLALYGYGSFAALRPVMSLKSQVVALRDVLAGESVSYGALFTASRATRVATVPIGYADGYSRRFTGRAEVLAGGVRCKVVGAVTMDMLMVDVTDVAKIELGAEVVLLGRQGAERISAEDLAGWSSTISWEIFCGISKRVPRVYLGQT